MKNGYEDAMNAFETTSKRRIKKQSFDSPKGHRVEGYIYLHPNEFLGSIYIDKVNGVKSGQLVRGMPKLKYWNEVDKREQITFDFDIDIRAKEDGTNIAFYGLQEPKTGKIIDVIPKTRKMCIADEMFLILLTEFDVSSIEDYIYLNGGTLCFELFGKSLTKLVQQKFDAEPEDINYETGLELKLLFGYSSNGKQYTSNQLDNIPIEFERPDKLFNLRKVYQGYIFNPQQAFYDKFGKFINKDVELLIEDENVYTLYEIYEAIAHILEEINKDAINKNIGYVIEGTIWYGVSEYGKWLMLKNKPKSIMEGHTCKEGIPTMFIRKALKKFIDEHPSDYEEIDKDIVVKFVNDELLEEFSQEILENKKTQQRIVTVFRNVFDKREIPDDIIEFAKRIIDDNPTLNDPISCIKQFAKEYPDKKKLSSKMFNAFNQIFKE